MNEETKELIEALKIARQTILEVGHAQVQGPGWYTRGYDGMYQHVAMLIRRGLEAVKILDRYEQL